MAPFLTATVNRGKRGKKAWDSVGQATCELTQRRSAPGSPRASSLSGRSSGPKLWVTRLIRQLLTESLILAAAGTALGLVRLAGDGPKTLGRPRASQLFESGGSIAPRRDLDSFAQCQSQGKTYFQCGRFWERAPPRGQHSASVSASRDRQLWTLLPFPEGLGHLGNRIPSILVPARHVLPG
jgi:hypothetical protein